MRRSPFLKYSSIMLMLSSLVRFFFGLSMLNFFVTAYTLDAVEQVRVHLAEAALAGIILSVVAGLVSSFMGALNWEEPLLAKKCFLWGIATLALGLFSNLLQAFTGYGISFVAWITGAGIPGLFLAGAAHFLYASRNRT